MSQSTHLSDNGSTPVLNGSTSSTDLLNILRRYELEKNNAEAEVRTLRRKLGDVTNNGEENIPHKSKRTKRISSPGSEDEACPPLAVSPHQDELPSDEYSDFPPIREHQSTPDPLRSPLTLTTNFFHPRSSAVRKGPVHRPEQCSSPTQVELPDPPPSQSPRYSRRRRNKGLGCKDILNTTEILMRYPKNNNHTSTLNTTEVLPIKYPKIDINNHKSTLKRASASAAFDSRPLKKYRRLTSVYKDDMDWIRDEIVDIKKCTREAARRMEKVLERLEQLS